MRTVSPSSIPALSSSSKIPESFRKRWKNWKPFSRIQVGIAQHFFDLRSLNHKDSLFVLFNRIWKIFSLMLVFKFFLKNDRSLIDGF